MTLLALALAAGLSFGRWMPPGWLWWCLALGAVAVIAGLTVHRRRPCITMATILMATAAFGAAWYAMSMAYAAPADLAAQVSEAPRLVHVRGVATAPPSRRDRTAGSLGRFDYRPVTVYFPMRVEGLIGPDQREHSVVGKIYVGVDETVPPFHPGDRVEAWGFLRAPTSPVNPGQFDYRRRARSLGEAGSLSVPSRDLLKVTSVDRNGPLGACLAWRSLLRRRAGGWLLSNLPEDATGHRDALLSALLLGTRELGHEALTASFRRTGLAHLLAISGLHLGVLAGFVLLILRFFGVRARWHGWFVIVVVLGYLVLVEVRMPVLRAGVMTIASSLAIVSGRRLRVGGLVALSAILLLIWRPDELFTAGFQLSFGVVLGIVHFAPVLRERWFGRPDMLAASTLEMLGHWLRTTVAVTTTAWMVAMPITAYHFGVISPMAVPMSVVALPMVALLLALGYLKMLLALLLPSGALLLGVPLTVGADALLSLIDAIDELPLSTVHVPFPSAWWTASGLGWVVLFAVVRDRRRLRWVWPMLGVIILWLVAPSLPWRAPAAMRIDMLAVGDGSCFVVQSAGRTMLFDAGSSTDFDAGRKVIVPALRRLDVRTIDFVVVSHANTDHYSAVLEVVDEFDVEEVLVTDHMIREARREPDGSDAYLLDRLATRFVRTTVVASGARRRLGDATITWLHPRASDRFRTSNDASMVLRIEAMGRAALLCGDIQEDAIARLLERTASDEVVLGADIMELPHHGSFNERAIELVRRVDPAIVLQSTGRRRWAHDRWAPILSQRERLVTARDGACRVEITEDGAIRWRRFMSRAPAER